jgi:GTP-binding protein
LNCEAHFVTSAADAQGFPREPLPELALVGRSNVGKSSLINALTGRRIARTSAAPGKTRLANVYRIARGPGQPFHLVDLPGYGYARGGAAGAKALETVTLAYFDRVSDRVDSSSIDARSHPPGWMFAGALLLVDSRHPELDADRDAWTWLGERRLPRHVVATKLDKLTRAERRRHVTALERAYEGPVTAVSAASGEGLEELWKLIARLLRQPPRTPAHPRQPSR